MTCPVCFESKAKDSYLPPTFFNNKIFNYLRCAGCKTIYIQPFPENSDFEKMYPPEYQGNVSAENTFNRDFNTVLNRINQYAKGKNILDYGCGNGSFLNQMNRHGYRCVGVEMNMQLLENMRKVYPAINFIQPDELTNTEQCFDVIFISNVLEHLIKPQELLMLLTTKLTKDGILVVQGPLEDNFHISLAARKIYFWLKKKLGRISYHTPTHIFQVSSENQLRMLQQCGLVTLKYEIFEQAWPFPSSFNETKGISGIVTLVIAKVSLFVKKFKKQWGNNFLYVGIRQSLPITTRALRNGG